MTFKEARDAIARNEGHADWLTCVFRENLTSILLLDEKANELYARLKWDEALNTILSDMEVGYLDNVKKLDNPEHKIVFQAIGESIKNYPKPEFKP